MTTSPVMGVTDELIAELEAELAAYESPTGPVRGVNLQSVRALLDEREELKRDAKRYRWLRELHNDQYGSIWASTWSNGKWVSLDAFYREKDDFLGDNLDLDAAIDAAMQS